MDTAHIKSALHEEIEHGDERLIKMIYAMVQEYNHIEIEEERIDLILQERERHFTGESKSYTWNEVKDMARDKSLRDGI